VLDLVKQSLNEGKITKISIYDILNLISYYYGDIIDVREFERFFFTTYSIKEHLIYPTKNRLIIKLLTFFFLISFYTSLSEKAEKLLEREIIKILINVERNSSDEMKVIDFFNAIFSYLQQLNAEKDFIKKLLFTKKSNELREIYGSHENLLVNFFIDFIQEKKKVELSIEDLNNKLEKIGSEFDNTSEYDNKSDIGKYKARIKYIQEKNKIRQLKKDSEHKGTNKKITPKKDEIWY